MAWRPIVQPTLVARWPQPLRDQLRVYGIAPRALSIDELDALLQRPPGDGALLIDLRGNTLAEVARLLGMIQAMQRRSDTVPLLVVPREAFGMQRLIAAAECVRAVVLDPDQPDTLAAWLIAPTALIPATIWVHLPRPALRHQHSQLAPLVAQLACAESLDQVARRAAITPRSIYTILHTWCGHIPGRRLPTERWYALLSTALCGRPIDLDTQQSTRRRPPVIDLRLLRRDLVGGVVEQLAATPRGPQLQMSLRHQQHAWLPVTGQPTGDLLAQPRWARVVEWVEQIPEMGLTIGTVGGHYIQWAIATCISGIVL